MKCQVKCYLNNFKQFNSYKLEMHKGGENLPRSASSYFFSTHSGFPFLNASLHSPLSQIHKTTNRI